MSLPLMQSSPNLRHLAALLEINRLGSINKAAEVVHLSQSALTQGLSKIEAELGMPLFDRSATGMYPNQAGKKLLERLTRAFHYFHSLERDLELSQPSRHHVHLSFSNAQLRALIAVVEQRNISLAAAQLSLAQPTVQRAVREVENICGQTLFIRSATGVDPTPLARKLAQSSSLAFAEIQAGFDEVHETQGQMRGRLILGSLPLSRTDLVPETVTSLLNQFPDLKIRIVDGPYEELLHGLTHGRIDIIVGALRNDLPSHNLSQEELFEDSLSVVVRNNHPLLEKKQLSMQNLHDKDWIAPRPQTPARSRFQDTFSFHNLPEPEHIIECSSSVATRGLLLRSDRLALLSKRQVQPDIQAGYLSVLPLDFNNSLRPIGITVRKDWRPTSAQQHYIELLKQFCQQYGQPD